MSYSLVQSIEGGRVSSGPTCSATLGSNLAAGSKLIAIIEQQATGGNPAAIGTVSDNQGNRWRIAQETCSNGYGLAVFVCENPTTAAPTITATQLQWPLTTTTNMVMWVGEYAGLTGFELVDAVGVGAVSTTSLTVTSNFATTAAHDLCIFALTGNMTAATVPSFTTSRLNDTTSHLWIADVDHGTASSVTGAWSSLTGGSAGCALLVCFRLTGVAATDRHLVQASYTEPPALTTNPGTLTKTSQAYTVNPTVGNQLIAFIEGDTYNDGVYAGSAVSVTDTAGNVWKKIGEQGKDNQLGNNWSFWACDYALGGATTLTITWDVPIQTPAFWLAEFANLPTPIAVDQWGSIIFSNSQSITTNAAIQQGDVAFMQISNFGAGQYVPNAAGWVIINSDTAGGGVGMMQLYTAAGVLTGGDAVGGVDDGLLVALCRSPGFGSH